MHTAQKLNPQVWLERHGDALFRFALARMGDRGAAEDAVQDTFVAALRNRESFAEKAAERTWLIGILKHRISDYYRRLARQLDVAVDDADRAFDARFGRSGKWKSPPAAWGQPAAALAQREFWAVLQECMSALPDKMAALLALRVMANMETPEICKVLELSPTHVWTLLHRARARLRECLEKRWFRSAERGAASRL